MKSASFALPRYARCWQPLQALSALHGAVPAPSNDLVRGQPDALFRDARFRGTAT